MRTFKWTRGWTFPFLPFGWLSIRTRLSVFSEYGPLLACTPRDGNKNHGLKKCRGEKCGSGVHTTLWRVLFFVGEYRLPWHIQGKVKHMPYIRLNRISVRFRSVRHHHADTPDPGQLRLREIWPDWMEGLLQRRRRAPHAVANKRRASHAVGISAFWYVLGIITCTLSILLLAHCRSDRIVVDHIWILICTLRISLLAHCVYYYLHIVEEEERMATFAIATPGRVSLVRRLNASCGIGCGGA